MRQITPNQLVAYNLALARNLRGLTQDQLGQRLEEATGRNWSKATMSALERTYDGDGRQREFSADDLVAFSFALGVPVGWFLIPPPIADKVAVVISKGSPHELTAGSVLDMALGAGDEAIQMFRSRLAELPAEERDGPTEIMAERIRGWVSEVVANELGDLAVWADQLRHLAGVFDKAWEESIERGVIKAARPPATPQQKKPKGGTK